MDNFLEKIDQVIVVTINSWHTPLLDEVMYLVSSKIAWIPLYFFLIYLAYKKFLESDNNQLKKLSDPFNQSKK